MRSVDTQTPPPGSKLGQIAFPAGTPETQTLRFKLSAS